MSKRICIIGGTGFVGRVVARQAVDAGHQVTVTTRHPARARDLPVQGIQVVQADLTTGKGLDEAIQNQDCVINLVGLLFEAGKNTFEAAHVEGVKKVVAACIKASVPQLLHMSALLSDAAAKSSKYASTKLSAESVVRDSELQWSIFRPSIIFGADDSFLMRFKSLSSFGPLLPVIAGNTKFQPIWVKDVARALVLSIGNQETHHQTYTLAGDTAYSFKEMLDLWMHALGRCRILLPVPGFAASLLATVSGLLPTPLITADQLQLLKHDNTVDTAAFPAQFGETTSFASLLPKLARGDQATLLQQRLDTARTHYRKS